MFFYSAGNMPKFGFGCEMSWLGVIKKSEKGCKPDSVENYHSSRSDIAIKLIAPYPPVSIEPISNTGLHGLAPRRVYLVSLLQDRSLRTCFLLHSSSPCGGRALPATLLYGVRTFLPQ